MPNRKKKTDQHTADQLHQQSSEVNTELVAQLAQLQQELQQARESERRALADYQNVVRRNQAERAQFAAFANKSLISDLLQPLDHLALAAKQLDDAGLNMVIEQLWQKLNDHGLERVELLEKPLDIELMEVVDTEVSDVSKEQRKHSRQSDHDGLVVTQVRRNAYTLNGQVIQHGLVVMGIKK